MKKKIINGLLFAVAMVAATSSFVSCKDYDADNYNELQAKYLSLQDAFNKQVSAMNDYVLKTTFNTKVGEIEGEIGDINAQTGYSAAELAAKGTIKKRLDDLESEYSTLNGKFNDELDPTKVGSLAYQIAQNNIAIATAQGLAERDSAYLRSLLAGWDNGGTLGDMVTEAAGLLTALKSDTAKYNFAYDTLSTYYQKWNEAVKLANEASSFIGASNKVKVQGQEVSSLQDMADAYDDAIANLQDQIDALKEELDNLKALIQQQVTGIEIQATYNPIFGTFSYPIGVQSNILAAYYGEFDKDVYFPAGDLDDGVWANEVAAVLNSELQAIGAPEEKFDKGIQMVEGAGNAGKLYVTVNPSDVVMDGKEFTLRASDNSVSKVALSPLETSTEQLKWGYNRAASANGFYVATAQIKKEDANDVALSFNLKGLASEIKDIMNNWSSVNASDIAKLALAVHDGMKVNVPRLGVQAQWKDELGWKNYVSKYDVAAFSVKPLGFDFLYDQDYSKGITKFKNKLIAKEKAAAQEFIQEIINMIQINFGLPTTGSSNIFVDETTGKIYLRLPANSVTISGNSTVTVTAGQFGSVTVPNTPPASGSTTYQFPATTQNLNASITAGNPNSIDMDITPLFDTIAGTIQKALANISGKASDTIHKYLDKIINVENKIFGKLESVAKNPNRFIQPAMIGKCEQLGFFYPSRNYLAPTQVKKGQKIMLYPTTLTGEVVAPAYKKYVAVCGAWDVNDVTKTKDAKQFNTGLNTIFNGADYNMSKPIEYTVDAPAGTVLEFIYECLGYNGKVAGKKYYIEVYE